MPFKKGHKSFLTKESKVKISIGHKGKKRPPFSEKWKKNISLSKKGKKHTIEHRIKIGNAHRGSRSNLWKGGITPINTRIRQSLEYKLWRAAVFLRDNWTCVWCKRRGVELNADHIKSFAFYPELRLSIDNGRTLCVPCHKTTNTYASRAKNYKKV